MAKAVRNNSIKIINHGIFSVKSENSNDTYTACFGDNKNMPSCSCPAWSEFYYPCKNFLVSLRNYLYDGVGSTYHPYTRIHRF